MNMLKWMTAAMTSLALVACGGGGGDSGTSNFGGGTTPTTPTSTAASIDVLTSAVQVGTGGDTVTITATVKDAANVGLSGAPVSFSTDTGTLTSATATTSATGVATALLSAGANKSNRTMTVTVRSGTSSASGTVQVAANGTVLTYSGPTTVALAGTASAVITATDSKGAAISGLAVTAASSLNNGLSATALTTDALGKATATYTASNSGTDSLKFTGGGATTTATLLISAANFAFTSPAASTQIPVNTVQPVAVRYLSNGAPQVGVTVNFSATAGTVSSGSVVTNSSGVATVNITSTTAGSAIVQATVTGGAAQATLPVVFVAQTPTRVVLQATPTAIGPNSAGATAQQSKLLATVTDASGNPVSGATVAFNRIADPSGGTLSQASQLTDSSGQATVQYIAGALTTASNGVQLQASVLGTSVVSPTATLTVNQSALFIALGTGNTILNLDEQTYQKNYVVYVTDANGVAVPNVVVTMSILPVAYGKGVLGYDGAQWSIVQSTYKLCANEDADHNGILSAGEDFNGNGRLDPGNVISVSTGTTTASANGTVTTDSTGRATISVIYAESYVPWVTVTLQAQAVVSGTQSTTSSTFRVTGAASDFTTESTAPAGAISPFGTGACNVAN